MSNIQCLMKLYLYFFLLANIPMGKIELKCHLKIEFHSHLTDKNSCYMDRKLAGLH